MSQTNNRPATILRRNFLLQAAASTTGLTALKTSAKEVVKSVRLPSLGQTKWSARGVYQ